MPRYYAVRGIQYYMVRGIVTLVTRTYVLAAICIRTDDMWANCCQCIPRNDCCHTPVAGTEYQGLAGPGLMTLFEIEDAFANKICCT